VALLVPYDVLDAEWRPSHADTEVDDRHRRAPAYRPVAARDDVERAATLLERAQRPLIVAGGGVHASPVTAELTALAEWLDAMVVTSFSGKGAVAETAPYAAGVLNPLGTTASLELARGADLMFWCGCKVGQRWGRTPATTRRCRSPTRRPSTSTPILPSWAAPSGRPSPSTAMPAPPWPRCCRSSVTAGRARAGRRGGGPPAR
jgi:thiamine pyrophosphate-dependent acetolactate synthase large subunit-like protein